MTKDEELKALVEEAISNAHYNGYGPEVNNLSDLELAWDLIECGAISIEVFSVEDIERAVKEFRRD